jgi:hypothetical protein
LAYADIDIIARTPMALKESFLALESAARKMRLQINEQKTKYMVTGRSQSKGENRENTFRIGSYELDKMDFFMYVGVMNHPLPSFSNFYNN